MEFLIESILLVTVFFLRLTFFGFLTLFVHSMKNKKELKIQFRLILQSFIFGFIFFLFISYCFTAFLPFNYITGNIFLEITDVLLISYIRQKNFQLIQNVKKMFVELKNNIKNKSQQIIHYALYFVIFLIFLIFQFGSHYGLENETTISLLGVDSYYWEALIYYLIESGSINQYLLQSYSRGFILLNASIVTQIPNVTLYNLHFFAKNIPNILFICDEILLFYIGFTLFKDQKYAPILVSIPLISFSFFMARIICFLPPIWVTFLLTFVIIFYSDNNDNLTRLIPGLICGSMILIHPLYGIAIFLTYCLSKGIFSLLFDKTLKNKEISFINRIMNSIKSLKFEILCFIIYMILYVSNPRIFDLMYDLFIRKLSVNETIRNMIIFQSSNIDLSSIFLFDFTEISKIESINLFLYYTITYPFILYFVVILLFIPIGMKYDENQVRVLIFSKLIMFFSFGIYLFRLLYRDGIFASFLQSNFQSIYENLYIEIFTWRIFDIMPIFYILLLFFGLKELKDGTILIWHKINTKIQSRKNIPPKASRFKITQNQYLHIFYIIWIAIFLINQTSYTDELENEHVIEPEYTSFLIQFREAQNQLQSDSPGITTLFFDGSDYSLTFLVSQFFYWDHNYVYMNSSTNNSGITEYINNMTKKDCLFISYEMLNFESLRTIDFTLYNLDLIFNSSKLIVYRKK